jgi:outer membrane protein OmpA-like peptidoglycan-associated protein/ABC-type nitrate/sulfonate/bicarbonate transport system substrate-binding protein
MTPLAKALVTVSILAVAGAAAWHLGLKDMIRGAGAPTGLGPGPVGQTDPSKRPPPPPPSGKGGALGTGSNPLSVSIVSFHGYAPALVANGKALETQPGSIFDRQGVRVKFVIQDNVPTLTEIFTSKVAQCAWRTSDFWAQEQPNLRNAGLDARAIMIVDNTQGGDAVIARDPKIQRIEDLADKSVALLQYTPSHGMVIDALQSSSLSARKKQSVKYVFINVEEGTGGVRAAFETGQVEAAVLWDPDLALALQNTPGAHVVYSTKTATNLIYDVIVCDKAFLDDPANEGAFQKLVAGWLEGVEASEKSPDDAVDALVKTEDLFGQLAKSQGAPFVKGLFSNLVWTGLDDNVRILGLAGGPNHYERVYKQFDVIYRAAGALANPNSPVINPSDSFDYRFVKALLAAQPTAKEEAAKPLFHFSEKERDEASKKPAIVTKPVAVTFKSGSAELSKRAQKIIDDEMVPLIENNGSAYFEVSGNTDATGARAVNMKLSRQRADAVVKYLIEQWEFPAQRFEVVGNGPDAPICNEKNPDAEGVSLDECQSMNRSTRLAVISRS